MSSTNQIQEEGNEYNLEYRLYKCWDSVSQSCICKLTKLYNRFLHCKKEYNRYSVDVGFHGRTTLKLLSSFFCLLSFSQSNVTSWSLGEHQQLANKASSLIMISSFATANY